MLFERKPINYKAMFGSTLVISLVIHSTVFIMVALFMPKRYYQAIVSIPVEWIVGPKSEINSRPKSENKETPKLPDVKLPLKRKVDKEVANAFAQPSQNITELIESDRRIVRQVEINKYDPSKILSKIMPESKMNEPPTSDLKQIASAPGSSDSQDEKAGEGHPRGGGGGGGGGGTGLAGLRSAYGGRGEGYGTGVGSGTGSGKGSGRGSGTGSGIGSGKGGGVGSGIGSGFGSGIGSGLGKGVGSGSGTGKGGGGEADVLKKLAEPIISLPEGKLGAVLVGKGADVQAHIRIIRLKHSLADWWQDPTALPSLIEWLKENTKIRADMNVASGALPATDPIILESVIVVMTGHDKEMVASHNLAKDGPLVESFTDQERAMLRKYLVEKGGTLFFDDCGFNGHFAEKVRQELRQILPEYGMQNIYNNHEIFKIYYDLPKAPTGGDVFWNSENKPQTSHFPYLDGITIGTRLAVIYNRKDYMCAMETADIPSRTQLRLRRSSDVYKFMTNVLFYAMKYGGNVDRSDYQP